MIESHLIYGSDWDETELQTMNYITALFRKKHSAEETLNSELAKPNARVYFCLDNLDYRYFTIRNEWLINEILRAMKFNQTLIDNCLGRSKNDS